jgi:AcrR family transcriptional regulator
MAGRDIERTLELLWGAQQEPTRGPKPRLILEEIVAAAVAIADAGGLDAVTMRRVAERFDVTTMALYRYLPSKDALLELMFDAVAHPPPDPADMPEDWREALRWWARRQREVLRRHPWLLSMPLALPPMGPNNIQWMECVLQAILRSGLPAQQSVAVLLIVANYTIAELRQQLSLQQAEQVTGVAYEDVGRVYAQLLERVVADGEHPALTSAIASGAFGNTDATVTGPEEDFEHGLEFILDGIEALAERHAAPQEPATVSDVRRDAQRSHPQ